MSLDVGLGGGTPVFIFCFRYLSDEVLQRLFWPVWGFTLPHPISLTRCGLPRNIPAFHRKMIRRRDNKADQFVKLYLSLYSISKCILVRERQGFGYRQRAPRKSSEISASVFRLLKGTHLLCSPFLGMLASGGYLNGRLLLLGVWLLSRVASYGLPYSAWSGIYSLYACGIEPSFSLGMTQIYISPLAI